MRTDCYEDYWGDEVCVEYCDTYCESFGGHFQWNETYSYEECVYEESSCTHWEEDEWGGFCDTWCQPFGGFFTEDGACSWEDEFDNEFGLCQDAREFGGAMGCDNWCAPFNGRFEMVQYQWSEIEDCVWENVYNPARYY